MKQAGVKNAAVAEAAGVHLNTVSQWLNNKFPPSEEALSKVAAALHVSEAWLRYGDSARTSIPPAADRNGRVSERQTGYSPTPALSSAIREFLAESQLEMVKAGALEEEVSEAMDLLKSPQVFTFYQGGAPHDFTEEQVLMGMRAIYNGVIKPELKKRGRKL